MPGPGFYLVGKEEEEEVLDVIRSGYFFRYGDESNPAFKHKVKSLEDSVATAFGTQHALAVTSGTAALISAYAAAGIGPGDEVIVPGYTFIASISAVIMCGAVPVLAEVDESLTLDLADVRSKITPRTKAIVPVHMLGNPCNMDPILQLADEHNLIVIEDAAQAFGGSYRGRKLGTLGHVGIYSFNLYKMINAGDGGMLVSNDRELYERAFAFHDQGHLPLRMGVEAGNRSIIGQNFRMNELTGAVLLAQFRKLDGLLERLRYLKSRFKRQLADTPNLTFRTIHDEQGECATLLTILLPDRESAATTAKALGTTTVSESGWHVYSNMEQLLEKKQLIGGCPFDCPNYPTDVEYSKGMLPRTDDILERAINISIGVVDAGLGASFGVSILSSDDEVDQKAEQLAKTVRGL